MRHNRIFTLVLFLFLLVPFLASGQNKKGKPHPPKKKQKVEMTFENELIHLGKVKKGDSRKFDFVFTNTGIDPITIDIISSCDCTTLDWPRKAIKPGQKGIINVTFDSTKKEISETIDVDIYLKNLDPKTGYRTLKIINYDYELVK
jgi:peptidoglycan-associated lipoprotein